MGSSPRHAALCLGLWDCAGNHVKVQIFRNAANSTLSYIQLVDTSFKGKVTQTICSAFSTPRNVSRLLYLSVQPTRLIEFNLEIQFKLDE